ncbi:hypothetical protein FCL47_14590 [Desulfopila sp. IMCC35006]|uniref:HGGxSTG domain-containing protein n=1 Tax=Desulfopila sp. IMCC35006 TaxID=2569542 RepID=UPI0010ACE86C|nr:HGGxSTG domain-containing protein [Desulfopila sp. IMCC35006]TKB25282.1 hypothetical protein FCL47_14590 [Desulfopila sp. IMCC35006]
MKELCGAKKRSGEPCRKPPMKGKARCRLHGGLSTGPPLGSKNAEVHGIYTRHLSAAESERFQSLQLGSVDDELKLCRIRLERALKAEAEQAGKLLIEESISNSGQNAGISFPAETRRKKVKDFDKIIDGLLARITRLEIARKALDSGFGDNDTITGFEVVEYPDEEPGENSASVTD